MYPAITRATLLAALLAGSAMPGFVAPALANDQACHDETSGTCCRWDDVLKRQVGTSCNSAPVAQTTKKPAGPATQATSATTAAGASSASSAGSEVSTGAATAASQDDTTQDDTTYGNPGNDKIGADGNPVGRAGETPGNNEEGSFGDGVKGRSDVAGGGSTDTDAGDKGAAASAAGGAGATGNNGNGDGSVGNSAGKGKD